MATHSCAYIPTNRKPSEYIMSEGWSDGMLGSTGLYWYQSTPRMEEAIRATLLLGGSPVFAPAGDTGFEIKEIDYIEDGVRDELLQENDDFVAGVAITLDALERGDWAIAESTAYGKMTLEEKMAMGLTINATLHAINDFSDLPAEYGTKEPPHRYDESILIAALTHYEPNKPYNSQNRDYIPCVAGWYFYHDTHKQWWGEVELPNQEWMYLPLILAFAIENKSALEEVKTLHSQYSEYYAKDIVALAAFEAARQT